MHWATGTTTAPATATAKTALEIIGLPMAKTCGARIRWGTGGTGRGGGAGRMRWGIWCVSRRVVRKQMQNFV